MKYFLRRSIGGIIEVMSDVTTLPTHGEVFLDARGGDRSMRISWHHESGPDGVVVLSLWRSGLCVGSFRLRSREVPLLIDALARGLGASWPDNGAGQQAPPAPAPPPLPEPPQQGPQQRPQSVPPAPAPGPGPSPVRPWPPIAPAAQAEPERQPNHDYGDVRAKPRYLGGPPNSSGAESWSA